jgi:hypothetical protein
MKWLLTSCIRLSLLSSLTVSAWGGDKPTHISNLDQIGYQYLSCNVIWTGEDSYPKRQIEFLDDEHLLVHYATSEACTGHPLQYARAGLHSAVIGISGDLLHRYDWQPSEDVIAGPDGQILVVSPDSVRVVDQSFKALQSIPWHQEGSPSARLFRVLITPSRHGFAIVDRNRASLYTGPPYAVTATTADFVATVTDHGFVALSGFDPGPPTLRVDGAEWPRPARPSLQPCAALGSNEILGLDRKFNLYRMDRQGREALIAHLGSLAPGMWNSGFRFDLALPDARRMLFLSQGVRIAFTDTSGVWKYFRSAVLDLKTSQLVFHYGGHFGDDVSLSPDGHFVAVREKNLLSIFNVP